MPLKIVQARLERHPLNSGGSEFNAVVRGMACSCIYTGFYSTGQSCDQQRSPETNANSASHKGKREH